VPRRRSNVSATASADPDAGSKESGLIVPGDAFFLESIAAAPSGTLYVSSVANGPSTGLF
jgi:hypothetical protein